MMQWRQRANGVGATTGLFTWTFEAFSTTSTMGWFCAR